MAENCRLAFGRYLKTLRERRGLSLGEVCSLSQTFPERINKGFLSRVENGLLGLGVAKLIPLSRIYEVPSDVLVERVELDLELDRVGGPVTEGKDYSELTLSGKQATADGLRWDAYGLHRDSIVRALIDPVREAFSNSNEQWAIARMNCATSGMALGRYRYSLNEYLFLGKTGFISPRFDPILLERTCVCYRHLEEMQLAKHYGEAAAAAADKLRDPYCLGYVSGSLGLLSADDGCHEEAIKHYLHAFRYHKISGESAECATILNNLAEAYFELGRLTAARRALHSSAKIAQQLKLRRILALGKILMGEIERRQGRQEAAIELWKEAADVGRVLGDRILRFKAEFLLFKDAHARGQHAIARAIERRLLRLGPWLPRDTPELDEFSSLAS